jgi:ubiquinone/menaquinone biosynthesis C-methylase UbiE
MSTNKKTIDWYNENADDYTKHVRTKNDSIYHSLYEKPAMYSLLPNIKGKKVISLGCGSGEDSNYLKKIGATKSIGIDISKGLIDIAKESYPNCIFDVMNMEKLNFSDKSFDFAYSSLAIHYIKDWTKTFKEVHRILKPNSYFLFSCEHPIMSSMEISKNDDDGKIKQLAIIKNKKTNNSSIVGDYLNRKELDIKFNTNKASFVTTWHKSISEIIGEARKAGFLIESFIEPKPKLKMKSLKPADYEILSKIPKFMIFRLKKI